MMPRRLHWLEDQYREGLFTKGDLELIITMEQCHTSTIFLAGPKQSTEVARPLGEGITTWAVRGYANFDLDMLPLDEKEEVIYESALLEVEFRERGLQDGLEAPIAEWNQGDSILGCYFYYKQSLHSVPRWKIYIYLPHKQMLEFAKICRSSASVSLELVTEAYGNDEPVVNDCEPDILLPIPQYIKGRGRFTFVRVINITCEHEEPFVLISP